MNLNCTIMSESLWDGTGPPGAIKYWIRTLTTGVEEVHGFNFVCPCGCGAIGGVRLDRPTRIGWQWNNDRLAPTVDPSIDLHKSVDGVTRSHWHGWLRNGEWQQCP